VTAAAFTIVSSSSSAEIKAVTQTLSPESPCDQLQSVTIGYNHLTQTLSPESPREMIILFALAHSRAHALTHDSLADSLTHSLAEGVVKKEYRVPERCTRSWRASAVPCAAS